MPCDISLKTKARFLSSNVSATKTNDSMIGTPVLIRLDSCFVAKASDLAEGLFTFVTEFDFLCALEFLVFLKSEAGLLRLS